MAADTPFPTQDSSSTDDDPDAELEDLATLDVEATSDEVMTAVHWIEAHTPGLGTAPQTSSEEASPEKQTRRPRARPSVIPVEGI